MGKTLSLGCKAKCLISNKGISINSDPDKEWQVGGTETFSIRV